MRALRRIAGLAAAALLAAAGPAFASPAGVPADAVKGDMSLGNPKAKVQVVEFASASCPHCAHFNETVFPDFRKKYVDTGRVHYTLREFLTAPPEVAAAGFLLARCGGRAKYFTILDGVFRSQVDWNTGDIGKILFRVGETNGLSEAQVTACLNDEAALKALNDRVAAAMQVVDSTPTFEVNGKRLQSWAELDDAIAAAEKAAGPAKPKPKRKGR